MGGLELLVRANSSRKSKEDQKKINFKKRGVRKTHPILGKREEKDVGDSNRQRE